MTVSKGRVAGQGRVTAHISFLGKIPKILGTVLDIKLVETNNHGGVKNSSRSCHHFAPHTTNSTAMSDQVQQHLLCIVLHDSRQYEPLSSGQKCRSARRSFQSPPESRNQRSRCHEMHGRASKRNIAIKSRARFGTASKRQRRLSLAPTNGDRRSPTDLRTRYYLCRPRQCRRAANAIKGDPELRFRRARAGWVPPLRSVRPSRLSLMRHQESVRSSLSLSRAHPGQPTDSELPGGRRA